MIADGHHRYETALAYRDERRAAGDAAQGAPHEWILAYFANAYAPGTPAAADPPPGVQGPRARRRGLARAAARLDACARCRWPDADAHRRRCWRSSSRRCADRHAFAVDDASRHAAHLLARARRRRELGVRVLHREVIEGVFGLDEAAVREGAIAYPKSAAQTARDLRAGRGVVALYLNPLRPEDVFRVTAAGEVLPQKSTFFTPKLPTGLVLPRAGRGVKRRGAPADPERVGALVPRVLRDLGLETSARVVCIAERWEALGRRRGRAPLPARRRCAATMLELEVDSSVVVPAAAAAARPSSWRRCGASSAGARRATSGCASAPGG